MKKSFWMFGAKLNIILDDKDTEAQHDLVEGYFPVGAQTPLHVHMKYTETFYVLEGKVTIYTPGNVHVLQTGEGHFIPKGVPHAVVNSSDAPYRALVVTAPSGFAKLIQSIGFEEVELPIGKMHDMELALQICEEIGDKILGPPGARP